MRRGGGGQRRRRRRQRREAEGSAVGRSTLAALLIGSVLGVGIGPREAGAAPKLPIIRIVESRTGGAASGSDFFPTMAVSGNGRYASFTTGMDLVPGSGFDGEDVFVRDIDERVLDQASNTIEGAAADGSAGANSISDDGRYVAFESQARNLGLGDADDTTDIYVYDRADDVLTWASKPRQQGARGESTSPVLSADGRYVSFHTEGTDILGSADPSFSGRAVRVDLRQDVALRIDTDAGFRVADVALTSDGRSAAFNLFATSLGGTWHQYGLYRRDLGTEAVTFVPGTDDPRFLRGTLVRLSDDGRYLYWEAQPDEGADELLRVDAAQGTVTVVPGGGARPDVSRDGKQIAYTGTSPEEPWGPVFVYSTATATSRRVDLTTAGAPASSDAYQARISGDGRYVLFTSGDENLIPSDTNSAVDLFRADLWAVPDVPRAFAVTEVSTTSVRVQWTFPAANGYATPNRYRVRLSEGGLDDSVDATLETGALAVTFEGLEPGRGYRFSVAAGNDLGYGSDTPYTGFVIPPFSYPDALVKAQFDAFRGRAATSAEIGRWINDVLRHRSTVAHLIDGIVTGGATETAVAPLVRLYQAYFLRAPDSSGLAYWVGRRTRGTTLARISSTFAASSEFARRYGSRTDRQFVELIYENVLHRPPDAGGLAYWTGRLDRRASTRGQVMTNFSESSENVRVTRGAVDVAVITWAMLGRAPTATESSALAASTREQVIARTFASDEYADVVQYRY